MNRPRTRLVQTISAFRRDFSVSGRMPWAFERFGELVGGHAHPRSHLRIGLIDIGRGRLDAEFLAFLDLHLFIDQFIDHFLADRRLARGQEIQLAALFDVVIGDGFAVDHHGHGLRLQRRPAGHQDQRRGATQHERSKAMKGRGARHDHLRCINPVRTGSATAAWSGSIGPALLYAGASWPTRPWWQSSAGRSGT